MDAAWLERPSRQLLQGGWEAVPAPGCAARLRAYEGEMRLFLIGNIGHVGIVRPAM